MTPFQEIADVPRPEDELDDASQRLVRALEKVRRLESEKRSTQISSPEFHQLAHAVTEASAEVMRIARAEEVVGDDTQPQDSSMDDRAVRGEVPPDPLPD